MNLGQLGFHAKTLLLASSLGLASCHLTPATDTKAIRATPADTQSIGPPSFSVTAPAAMTNDVHPIAKWESLSKATGYDVITCTDDACTGGQVGHWQVAANKTEVDLGVLKEGDYKVWVKASLSAGELTAKVYPYSFTADRTAPKGIYFVNLPATRNEAGQQVFEWKQNADIAYVRSKFGPTESTKCDEEKGYSDKTAVPDSKWTLDTSSVIYGAVTLCVRMGDPLDNEQSLADAQSFSWSNDLASPKTVDGLAVWFSGGYGVTSDANGRVSRWEDRSGHNSMLSVVR